MTQESQGQKPTEARNFDPLKSLSGIRDSVSRIIEDGISAVSGATALPLDIYETETAVVIKAGPLPGVDPDALDVSVTGDALTIKGDSKPEEDIPAEAYLRRERKFGPFARTVKLQRAVRPDKAEADFKEGVLTITLPKIENADPKVINVRSANT